MDNPNNKINYSLDDFIEYSLGNEPYEKITIDKDKK